MKDFNIMKISLNRHEIVQISNINTDYCQLFEKLSTRKRLSNYENVCVNIYLHKFVP